MKSTGTCPKCSSQKIGYLENVIQRTEGSTGEMIVRGHCAAPLGTGKTVQQGIFKVTVEAPIGTLEAYFCADCGFYETYVKDPASIEFEKIIGFKWR